MIVWLICHFHQLVYSDSSTIIIIISIIIITIIIIITSDTGKSKL